MLLDGALRTAWQVQAKLPGSAVARSIALCAEAPTTYKLVPAAHAR
jgi:hypothetical protein